MVNEKRKTILVCLMGHALMEHVRSPRNFSLHFVVRFTRVNAQIKTAYYFKKHLLAGKRPFSYNPKPLRHALILLYTLLSPATTTLQYSIVKVFRNTFKTYQIKTPLAKTF